MTTVTLEFAKGITDSELQSLIENFDCKLVDFIDNSEELDTATRQGIKKGVAQIDEGVFFSNEEVLQQARLLCTK